LEIHRTNCYALSSHSRQKDIALKIRIDRDLPVSISQQLRGQIEYGIACGELPPGEQLPSVRELAEELGMATVTVSQVYKELQSAGLLESQPGRGTFVNAIGSNAPEGQERALELQRQIDRLIAIADAHGVSRVELSGMVSARLGRHTSSQAVNLVFVGIFPEATRSYANELKPMLHPGDRVQATTLEHLQSHPSDLRSIKKADLLVAIAHRKAQVQAVVGPRVQVVTVNFIPSERTRTALAELGPRTRLGIVSTFPEFLPTMKAGVERFASHLDSANATVLEDRAGLEHLMRTCDVIVYATGSGEILEGLPEHIRAFEYRHVPDPRSVERDLLPVIERLREQKPEPIRSEPARR
jgi:DNA-binding transcriptional regulator YhcF (GntR family)